MRIRVLSDLHLEFSDFTPPAVEADVVVLAGDIHVKTRGVAWAVKHFPETPVIYVPGNHEHYGSALGRTTRKLKEAAADTNVHVLQDEALVLNGVRFLGATLWTDYRLTGNYPLAAWDAVQRISDFKRIRTEAFHRLRPENLVAEYVRARAFFDKMLAEPFSGKTVMITHHAPSGMSIHPRYWNQSKDLHLNASYASNLDHLLAGGVDLAIHGHTHDSLDYLAGDTRVVCNPRGYVPEEPNPDFDAELVLAL